MAPPIAAWPLAVLFSTTIDARLIALDRYSGAMHWQQTLAKLYPFSPHRRSAMASLATNISPWPLVAIGYLGLKTGDERLVFRLPK